MNDIEIIVYQLYEWSKKYNLDLNADFKYLVEKYKCEENSLLFDKEKCKKLLLDFNKLLDEANNYLNLICMDDTESLYELKSDFFNILDYNYDKVVTVKQDRNCSVCKKLIKQSSICITGSTHKKDVSKLNNGKRVWICPFCFKSKFNKLRDFNDDLCDIYLNMGSEYED